eukprot:m.24022 g.24022  ORF g.24022 m.24022 type:complete len:507 (-) comp5606_c0_seq2:380-1900(-)
MDQPSSWALAPDRGLHKLQKEDLSEWDGIYNEVPSFQPELMSSPEHRQKARSSGYGIDVPVVKKVVLKDDDLRPWEEQPTFKPELAPSKERTKARSSKYGKKIPIRKEKEPELPTFKPEVNRPKTAQKAYKHARSSGYGRRLIEAKKPKNAETYSFRPKLSSSVKLRSQAKSSKYGKKPIVSRSVSANASFATGKNGFDTSASTPQYIPRYTLLSDKSHEDPLKIKEPESDDGGFVLDGTRFSNSYSKLHNSFPQADMFTPPKTQLKQRKKAASSKYGVASPEVGKKVVKESSEGVLVFDAATSVLNAPYQPFVARNPQTTKARSSKYGVASPAQAPKPQPKPSEPTWNVNVVRAAWDSEAPPAPRNPLTSSARSNKYGKVAPPRGDKFEYQPQPLWLPSGKAVVKNGPAPVPRSQLNDQVESHYGRHYDPASLYAYNGDEEFDDEIASSGPEIYDDEEEEYVEGEEGDYVVEGDEEEYVVGEEEEEEVMDEGEGDEGDAEEIETY